MPLTRRRERTLIRIWQMDDFGLVFVHVPKVATRSIRASLAAFAEDGRDAGRQLGTSYPGRAIETAVATFERLVDVAEIRRLTRTHFTFGFVRNPLDRLYSVWADKVVGTTKAPNPLERDGISRGVTFEAFVQRVAGLSDARCDRHIRSQHRFLCDRRGPVVSFVGRFESLADDWEVVRARFGLPALPHYNPSTHSDYRDAYSASLVGVAAQRYRRDVERFGYEADVRALVSG